jgi:hypothetical protein
MAILHPDPTSTATFSAASAGRHGGDGGQLATSPQSPLHRTLTRVSLHGNKLHAKLGTLSVYLKRSLRDLSLAHNLFTGPIDPLLQVESRPLPRPQPVHRTDRPTPPG